MKTLNFGTSVIEIYVHEGVILTLEVSINGRSLRITVDYAKDVLGDLSNQIRTAYLPISELQML